jgi:hypothetical protein
LSNGKRGRQRSGCGRLQKRTALHDNPPWPLSSRRTGM